MVDEAKYKKWLMLDTLLIVFMWLFLVVSETYVVATMLKSIIDQGGFEYQTPLLCLFAVIMVAMFAVNGLACWNVRKSITKHMYELKYYD